MKKTFRTLMISLMAVLMLLTSCNDKLQKMEEGSVNEYIYPYIKFKPAEDGNSVTAVVVAGAQLITVKIPASVDGVKVNAFIGFENPEDAKSVKEIVIGSHDTVITDEALKQAINLEQVKVEKAPEIQYWGKLPTLEKDGYEFLGWYVGDEPIYEGMPINQGNTVAVPKWRPHRYVEHEGKEPTCTLHGWKPYKTCEDCDYTDYVEIPALGHDVFHVAAKSATCTDKGNREYWKCNRCGKMFSDETANDEIKEVVLNPIGHNPIKNDYVPPRCDSYGIKEYWECQECKLKFYDEKCLEPVISDGDLVIAKTPHTPKTEWSSDNGYHWHVCSACGDQVDYESHTWDDGEIIVQAEANKSGKVRYTCTKCKFTKVEDLKPEAEHDFVKTVFAKPDCFKDGFIIWKCNKCGLTYTQTLDKINHKDKAKIDAKPATCTKPGNIKYWYCKDCGKYFRDSDCRTEITLSDTVIEATGHVWGTKLHFDKQGHWVVCTKCSAESEKIPHNFVIEDIKTEALKNSADCLHSAVYYRSCECGAVDENDDNTFMCGQPEKHNMTIHEPATIKPCAPEGHVEYWYCDSCKKYYADENGTIELVKLQADHIPSNSYVTTATGHRIKCSVCLQGIGTEEPHEIDYESDNNGRWAYCKVCNWKSDVKPHEWETVNGKWVCKNCGYNYKESPESGGFDVDQKNMAPNGILKTTRGSEDYVWVFQYESINPDCPMDTVTFKWYLDGKEIQGEVGSSYTLKADEVKSYSVMVAAFNDSGVGSASDSIIGGVR